jgi:hypothetical protein
LGLKSVFGFGGSKNTNINPNNKKLAEENIDLQILVGAIDGPYIKSINFKIILLQTSSKHYMIVVFS